jgi:hypothetical protein
MPGLNDEEDDKSFAGAKGDLGLDQAEYGFADRIINNPDIPKSENVEDRRGASDTLGMTLKSDTQSLLSAIPFEAKRRYNQVADLLGLSSDKDRMDELKKLAGSFK